MKKRLVVAILSLFLLVSCSSNKVESIESQLANNYNFTPLNIELSDYDEVYQNSIKSSLLILNCRNTSNGAMVESTGSGFVYKRISISNSYYVITNRHVVQGAQVLYAVTHTGQIVDATLVGTGGRYLDVAVIRIDGARDMEIAPLYNGGNVYTMEYLKPGEEVYALGTPSSINLFGTISKGVVAGDKRVLKDDYQDLMDQAHAIQIDVSINPGNSGGPLFNTKGEVVGVNTFKLNEDVKRNPLVGVNFALPIHDMIIAAEQILKLGLFKPFTLGGGNILKDVEELSLYDRDTLNFSDEIVKGVLIERSNNYTLETNTIITKFNGKQIDDCYDLRRALFESTSGKAFVEVRTPSNEIKNIEVVLVR